MKETNDVVYTNVGRAMRTDGCDASKDLAACATAVLAPNGKRESGTVLVHGGSAELQQALLRSGVALSGAGASMVLGGM